MQRFALRDDQWLRIKDMLPGGSQVCSMAKAPPGSLRPAPGWTAPRRPWPPPAMAAGVSQNITIALGPKAAVLVTTVLSLTGLWPNILADTGATVLAPLNASWNGPDARVTRIAMEARAPVDDVTVDIHDGRRLFIQAKTSVSLSTAKGSDLLSFVDQAIRLFSPAATPANTPCDPLFVPDADAILLAISPTSPATVRLHLKQAIDLARHADTVAAARAALNNDDQKSAYDAIWKAIEIAQPTTSRLDDDTKLRLLRSIHVAEFDTQGADKRAAVALLSACLERPGDAEAAFNALAHHLQQLMKDRGVADAKPLRAALLLAKLPLTAPPSYAKDVERLRLYSKLTLEALQAQQSVSSAGNDITIARECVLDVCGAIL